MTTQMDTTVEQADVQDTHEEIQPAVPAQCDDTPAAEDAHTAEAAPAVPAVEETTAQNLEAILVRAAVANHNADRAVKADVAAKKDVVKVLGRKGSRPVMNPLNPAEEFVQVTVSKLTYTAKPVDPAATRQWIEQKYPEKVEKRRRITTKFSAQHIIEILEDLAPFLLETVKVIPDHVLGELVRKSQQAQQPMGFGGEVGEDAPPGIVVEPSAPKVMYTFRNPNIVDDLLINGVVDMEGNLLGGGL